MADEFRKRLLHTHAELLVYPLKYMNLQVALCEHFGIIVDEIENLAIRKIRTKLFSLGLHLPAEPFDDYLELAGFLYASDGTVIIFIEKNDIEERKKFSLAHETAHFLNEYFKLKAQRTNHTTLPLFEEKTSESHVVIAKRCTKNDVFGMLFGKKEPDFHVKNEKVSIESLLAYKQKRQDTLREKICDWFAAELLMPVDIVRQLESKWMAEGLTLDQMINGIQESFEVSFFAAQVRADELQLGQTSQDYLIG